MSQQIPHGAYSVGTGISPIYAPVFSPVSPTSASINYPQGQVWVNTASNVVFQLTSFSTSGGTLTANWQEFSSSTGGILPVSEGGTGDSSLTAHGVLIGEGTSPVNVTTAGTSGQALVSGGASADPAFGITGVNGGGTGVATLTGLAFGNGTSAFTPVFYSAANNWSPTIAINGLTGGIAYTTSAGYYLQLGNAIFITAYIVLSTKGSNSGNVTINNLPVATGANGVNNYLTVSYTGATLSTGYTDVTMQLATTSVIGNFLIYGTTENGYGTLTAAQITNTTALTINGVYFTT